MNRLILALLLALIAVPTMAQERCGNEYVEAIREAASNNDTDALHTLYQQNGLDGDPARLDARFIGATCAEIEHVVSGIKVLDKTLEQIEAEEAIAEQEQANRDIVNAAQRMIQSGNRADVISGLESLQRYLARAEAAFRNQNRPACTGSGGPIIWNRYPCDPLPGIKAAIDRDFNRHGWPVADSSSTAYSWLVEQYRNGPEAMQQPIRGFANSNAYLFLETRLLARVEQMNQAQLLAASTETRRAEREAKIARDATLTGNFTSMGDRAGSAIKGWLGSGLALFVLLMVVARVPLPLSAERRGTVGMSLVLVWIAMLPFYALYVLFGGWWDGLSKYIPGILRLPLLLAVFVPAYVLVSRALKGRALLPSFLLRSPVAAAGVAAGGLHGSAHWSSSQDGIARGRYQKEGHVLADSHGFTLGRAPDAGTNKALKGYDSRFRYMGHVLTVAPNGSGKGTGAVVPALLDYPGSTIVLDVKGENYAVTARFRREQLGHDVYLVDPFGVTGQPSHGFNWLDRLNPDDPDVVGESATLADMLVVSEGSSSDSSAHFNETAKNLIRGLMVHVATFEDRTLRTMSEVRRLLTLGGDEFDLVLAEMIANPRGYDLPARAANAFSDAPDKERGSILSTARRHLAFLDDPRIADALSRSDFTLDDLKTRKMTVYLVMPPTRLAANRAFVRAFFGQAINAVMSSAGKPAHRVLFLLDEFPQLGRMDIVEEKLPLIRGYGGAFWLIAQNLAQLKETYPRWQNFIANCGAKQFFGTNDVETARYISDSLGKMTVEYHTKGASSNAGTSISTGSSDSQQFTGRELLTPDEIMRLPGNQVIALVTGEAPWMLTRLTYFADAEYVGTFDPNPYE